MKTEVEILCPICRGYAIKVIYAGFPAKFCLNQSCGAFWGLWSWVIALLPFNGVFLTYSGGYFHALWKWLTSSPPDW